MFSGCMVARTYLTYPCSICIDRVECLWSPHACSMVMEHTRSSVHRKLATPSYSIPAPFVCLFVPSSLSPFPCSGASPFLVLKWGLLGLVSVGALLYLLNAIRAAWRRKRRERDSRVVVDVTGVCVCMLSLSKCVYAHAHVCVCMHCILR